MQLFLATVQRLALADGTVRDLAPLDAALLAWLAIEGPTPRARVAQLLWPDTAVEAARNSLRQRLFQLRRQFGVELVAGSATLALADAVVHDLDGADALLQGVAGETIARGEFAQWLELQRARRGQQARRALTERATAAEQARDWDEARRHAAELLALEPLSEDAHRRVMRLHYLAGDRAAALLAFDRCERMLKDEIGARPSAETLALLETISATTAVAVATRGAVPASVLRPPRLIGRARELAALAQAWRAGHVVALTGEAGLGKTRLLRAFIDDQPGFVFVSARPGDERVPFATAGRLARAIATAQATAPATADGALARALPGFGVGLVQAGDETQQHALVEGVRSLIGAAREVDTVVVDDLHFADEASVETLGQLIDGAPADGASMRWILAFRPVETGRATRALQARLAEQTRWSGVPVAPLGEAALAELVDSLALEGVSGSVLAPHLLRRTGGNPLFVLETLKQAWAEGSLDRLATELPRPLSVVHTIERRLEQLSPQALALARCAAIAGQAFTPELAAGVLKVHALALADAWAELERAQIMVDQDFTHDLYYEAALASVPAAIARHLHAEVATCLEQAPPRTAAPATLARHWLAAHRPERAIAHLEAAAAAARDALDPALAASFLSDLAQARHAAGEGAAAFAAAFDAVTALSNLETGAALAAAIDRLQALARNGEERAIVHKERAGMHLMRGEYTASAQAVACGLAEIGAAGSRITRLNLLNVQGNCLRRLGRLTEARSSLEQALALVRAAPAAEATEVAGELAPVLNNLALVLQEMDEHLAASGLLQEAAGAQNDPLLRARVLNNLGISLEERGQVALAYEQRLAAARLCATAKSEGVADLMLAISLGANARILARFREAIGHLERAERIGATVPHWRQEDVQRQYAALWIELGRLNLARQALEAAARMVDPDNEPPVLSLTRARYQIALGTDARPLLDRAERILRDGREWRVLRRVLVCKAQVLPPAEAVAVLDELLQSRALQDNAGAAIACHVRLAQALLATGQGERALRHAQRAADALDVALPLDLSCAEVWLTLARVLAGVAETAAAAAAAERGRRWVLDVAQQHVDAPYRDGYLQRNPVNRDLIALATKLGAAGR